MLRLLPIWVWVALAALIAIGVQTARMESLRTEYAEYVAQIQKNTADAQEAARAEEQRRLNESQQVQAHAKQALDQAQSDAAASATASGQLRDQLAKLQLRIGGGPGHPPTSSGGASATRAALLLSQLLERANNRAAELAGTADQSRIRGSTCERLYDSLSHK